MNCRELYAIIYGALENATFLTIPFSKVYLLRVKLLLSIFFGLIVGLRSDLSGSEPISDPSAGILEPSEFTFVRIQFNSFSGRYSRRGRTPGWKHDYPRADSHLLKILGEVTNIETNPESYLILSLDDPAIMNYPFLYFSEPGTWEITEAEAANFREYLNRGGFAIFDDFDGSRDWSIFESCMRQVFPERQLTELHLEDPIFHCFYDIESLDMIPPYNVRGKPQFLAMRDDSGRIQVVANFNNDIGDFWEWSDQSFYPIDLSNEAYKFGVNYVVYALTH